MQLNGFNHVPLQLSERIIEHPEDATHAIVIIEGENGKKKPYAAWRAMKYTCSNEEDIRNLPTESNQFAQDNDFNKNTLTIFQNYLLDQINKTLMITEKLSLYVSFRWKMLHFLIIKYYNNSL